MQSDEEVEGARGNDVRKTVASTRQQNQQSKEKKCRQFQKRQESAGPCRQGQAGQKRRKVEDNHPEKVVPPHRCQNVRHFATLVETDGKVARVVRGRSTSVKNTRSLVGKSRVGVFFFFFFFIYFFLFFYFLLLFIFIIIIIFFFFFFFLFFLIFFFFSFCFARFW